jgi:hypothetical protein
VEDEEDEEAGSPEEGVVRTRSEAEASVEAEGGEAAAVFSGANRPLCVKVLYIFLKKKPCKNPRPCAL